MTSIPPSAYGSGHTEHHQTVYKPRCWQCKNVLAEYLTEPFSLRCKRCKAQNSLGATLVAVTT